MLSRVIETLGVFLYPQLALSVVVVGLCLGYGLAALRGELGAASADAPWRRQLEPLGGIAVSVGLLGSVVAFITAFSGFSGGVDIDRIVDGLGTAYTTTAFGLITAIIASVGAWACDVAARRKAG